MSMWVEKIFHEVADLSDEARSRYFAENGIDAQARLEVEALLCYDFGSTTLLERELGDMAEQTLARLEPDAMLCGPYRLGDMLGRGGMGTVYLATRVDGEVCQQVAVKLLRPGVDDPETRRRFLAERQILAGLSHPNIARLLDAGHREDGQPFLAMEYVEGRSIDAYTTGLGIRQKIALFVKVCAAVAYLHRNLVVHRDLKPANILVTDDGEPKLLDFGIAKMLDFTADATMTGMRMLTPDYASPEQMTGQAVTTATDVYSLGAVLYRLLTGVSPHVFSGGAGAAMAFGIANGSITPPSKRTPALKGDLEIILMKALRREPLERYATIDQFSDDLENYLASRPIRARKGDAWYRTQKWLRRYWLPATAATLTLAGLSAGLLIANRERAIAQYRFVQVRQLANKLFDIDLEARKVPGNTKTRQLIVDTSLDYLRRLSAEVKGDPDLSLELANAYMRVARVQGVPITSNLGRMDLAEQNLGIASRYVRVALAAQPVKRIAYLRAAQIAQDRMVLAKFGGRFAEAGSFAHEAAKWLDRFHAGKDDVLEGPALLNTYSTVANQFRIQQQFDDALRLFREGLEVARATGNSTYAGDFLWGMAEVYRDRGELDQSLQVNREAVSLLESNPAPGSMNLVIALTNEGKLLGQDGAPTFGRYADAAVLLDRAFQMADEFVHQDWADQLSRNRLADAGMNLAGALRHLDARRALEVYDHTFRHLAEIKNNSGFRRFEVCALAGSTYPLRELGRPDEAKRRLDAAFERLKALKLYPAESIGASAEADETLSALADYEAGRGAAPRAIEIYEEVLRKVQASKPEPETNLQDALCFSRLYGALAGLNHRTGHRDRSTAWDAKRLALWQYWDARLPGNTFVRGQLTAANVQIP
ncbi:MAG TPA: protein kinase [Candidatus Acidoferrum sp.]|nr:protein kinase [Candidatus Acidoferrum sp.]